MGKIRRPKKNSVWPLPIYGEAEAVETPDEVSKLLEAIDEDERQLSRKEVRDVVDELRTQIVAAQNPKPKAVTTDETLKDVVVGCIYKGPKVAQRWTMQQSAVQLNETKRLGQERREFKRETIPELYGMGAMTPEGLKEYRELVGKVFSDGVAWVDGVEGIEHDDAPDDDAPKEQREAFKAEVLAWLEELGFVDQLRLMAKIVDLQSVRRAQAFPAAGAGGLESEAA